MIFPVTKGNESTHFSSVSHASTGYQTISIRFEEENSRFSIVSLMKMRQICIEMTLNLRLDLRTHIISLS